MNKYNDSAKTKETYKAPLCETHVIIPEGMVCSQSLEYGLDDQNDNGGWL